MNEPKRSEWKLKGVPKEYSEKYDAYYDPETGEWLESKCGDPECEFCSVRPINGLAK